MLDGLVMEIGNQIKLQVQQMSQSLDSSAYSGLQVCAI
jgi:hypothetical protein